jgi:hypothetical protein
MTDCEPCLTSYAVCFHQVFTLVDPSMNSSEIKPLHLAIPRSRGSARPSPQLPPEKPKPDEPVGGRIPQTTLPSKPNRPSAAPTVHPPQSDPPLKSDAFWLSPLSPSATLRFQFKIEDGSFRILSESDSQVLLTALPNGAKPSAVRIFAQDQEIGEGKWDKTSGAFFAGVNLGGNRGEACCAIYNGKSFVFVIPAIKKIEGKPRMCPISMGEVSELCALTNKNAKEAVKLKMKEAIGGDLTFGGKFDRAAPTNFQLFHESNAKKNLCSFGMNGKGDYVLEVSYPLSPLQGFVAAVCAVLA